MQKLNLTSRPAKIGKSVNTRTEMHGKEEVPGQDIPLHGMLLSIEEVMAVTDEETAGEGLFKMEGDQYIPRFMNFGPIPLSHKFENATVKISGGVPNTTYKNGKIKGIHINAVGGGMTEMFCTLQVNPQNGDPSAQDLINAKIKISIKAELEEEEEPDPELPLDHQNSASGEDGEAVPLGGLTGSADIDETTSRTGRKIQASARKKSRKK